MQLVRQLLQKGQRVMVFCNTLDSCRAVDHALDGEGVRHVGYHGDIPLLQRKVLSALLLQQALCAQAVGSPWPSSLRACGCRPCDRL